MPENTLDISWETIVKFLIIGFSLYILFLTREIIIWFLFALIISLLVQPAVNLLRWLKVPNIISVILVYVSLIGLLGLIIYLMSPIFIYEINQLSQNLPMYFEKAAPILKEFGIQVNQSFEDSTSLLMSGLKQSSSGLLKALAVFFGGLSSTFVIFTLAFFISLEEGGVERVVYLLSPARYEQQTVAIFQRAQYKVSRWFGARILACVFVAVASFITFYLLDIKYAFTLALISGVLNFVPYIGPTISLALTVLFVGISNDWVTALYVLVIILVIQEIENKAVTPLLMKKFMDLPPVLVLIALLVGGIIFGFLGTVFAVPVFGIIYEFTKEFLIRKKEGQGAPAVEA